MLNERCKTQLVEYFKGRSSLKALPGIITALVMDIAKKDSERAYKVHELSMLLQGFKNRASRTKRDSSEGSQECLQQRYQNIKSELKTTLGEEKNANWKDRLFNVRKSEVFFKDLRSTNNFHWSQDLDLQRIQTKISLEGELSTLIGVTYSGTDRPNATVSLQCLDADYNYENAGATADGLGEYKNEALDKKIARNAYLSAKNMARMAASYTSAKKLYEESPLIFRQVGDLVKEKSPIDSHPESAGCVFTRVFPGKDESYDVVTGSVGDCMAFAWDPVLKKVTILAPARQYNLGFQFNPMSVTDELSDSMIYRSINRLNTGEIIFRMTDGAWSLLPSTESAILTDVKTNKQYVEINPDVEGLKKLFLSIDKNLSSMDPSLYCSYFKSVFIRKLNEQKEKMSEVRDQLINVKLSEYKSSNTQDVESTSVLTFLQWAEKTDVDFAEQLKEFLRDNEYVSDKLGECPLLGFVDFVERTLEVGDDLTMNIQQLRESDVVNANEDDKVTRRDLGTCRII